jgi:hypothetical protein
MHGDPRPVPAASPHEAGELDGDPDVLEYRRRFAGLTRGELQRHAPRLYGRLYRKRLLHVVPRRYRRFSDPYGYYQSRYAGLTRAALNRVDPSLYKRLAKDGLLHKVPCRVARKPNPFEEYQANYPGVTRGQLQIVDARLYMRLRNAGCLQLVPTKRGSSHTRRPEPV